MTEQLRRPDSTLYVTDPHVRFIVTALHTTTSNGVECQIVTPSGDTCKTTLWNSDLMHEDQWPTHIRHHIENQWLGYAGKFVSHAVPYFSPDGIVRPGQHDETYRPPGVLVVHEFTFKRVE